MLGTPNLVLNLTEDVVHRGDGQMNQRLPASVVRQEEQDL